MGRPIAFLAIALVVTPSVTTCGIAGPPSRYEDDTYAAAKGLRRLVFTGDFPAKPVSLPPEEERGRGPLFLDLRAATFSVSNSRNPRPTPEQPCDKGDLPTNKVGFSILEMPDVTVAGAAVRGTVPQDADWRASYCNSAAIIVRDSPRTTIDGVRVSKAWDGIRFGRDSGDFQVRNSWLSDVRDDAVENDRLHGGDIVDSLFDGILQGMAVRPNAESKAGSSSSTVEIRGSLFRLREFASADGRWRMGSLVKNDPRSPTLVIRNSVIALDAQQTSRWSDSWPLTWQKVTGASNNLILWLSDRPMPPGWTAPPKGFRLLSGAEARSAWAAAKRNWIDCHPQVRRLPGDPPGRFSRCRPGSWGGYSS